MKSLLPLCGSVLLLAACSDIDEADRLIYVQPATVGKHVLIEDFTGQFCLNCPTGSDSIRSLQKQYGEENIIVVGLHSGPFGKRANGQPTPLYTETGDYYYNLWNIESQPCVKINRQANNSNYAGGWQSDVYNAIQQQAPLDIVAHCDYDSAARKADIAVTLTPLSEATLTGTLQVWLTEDSIVDYQRMPSGSYDREYVHRHVFRQAVNNRDGDAFALSSGMPSTMQLNSSIDEGWRPEQMAVVVIATDIDGVMQVVSTPLTSTGL